MDIAPKLVPGPAFHLEGDGRWDVVEEVPSVVLRRAEYSGEVKIDGEPAVVFEMPDGDQWAQRAPGQPGPKGDSGAGEKAVEEALRSAARALSASFPDPFVQMGKRVAKMDLERNQVSSAKAMLEGLDECRDSLERSLRHSRVLSSSDPSFEWITEQLEAKKEEVDGIFSGIRDAIDYVLRD